MTGTRGEPRVQPPLGHRDVLAVYAGLMLAMGVASLDQTIMATALPTIARELGGLAHVGWVTTAYLATSTAAAVIFGKLSDLRDRKSSRARWPFSWPVPLSPACHGPLVSSSPSGRCRAPAAEG